MNAKKPILTLFSFLLLFLFINFAYAQEDFTAFSKPSIELCPCSNQVYSVTVQNTGSVASSYMVLATGEAAEWVTFNPKIFVLNPGQSGRLSATINSVCNIDGKFDLDIFITTANGLTKVVKQNLEFLQCYDYSLEQGQVVDEIEEQINYVQNDATYELCTNEQQSIPILIKNGEDFENKYRLFLDAPEWAKLNVNDVSLDAKKSGIFFIDFDTTDVLGDFDFKLDTISQLGKVQRKSNLEINVGECFALSVDIETEKVVICGGEASSYDVIVENLGTLRQNIDLKVEGPEWAKIENGSLRLSSGSDKTVELNVNPPNEISGNFLITVNAIPEDKTELKFSDSMGVEVVDKVACYRAEINAKSTLKNLYNEDFISIKVTNNGIRESDYKISLEGPSWASISPTTLSLNPLQIGNLNLNLNPTDDIEPGTFGVKINVESNDVLNSRNIDIKLRKESELEKKIKSTFKVIQYYIYLAIAIIILFLILLRPIIKIKNKIKVRHEKYKIKQERIRALKLEREKREEEKQKKKELEEERKEKEREKTLETERKKKKFKTSWKKHKAWIYSLVVLAVLVLLGQYFKLYNLKYTNIYLRNIFYGYLYYILMGVGVVVLLFLLILLYNHIRRKKKVKKESIKPEKTNNARKSKFSGPKFAGKERWYSKPSYVIAVFVPILVILVGLAIFNLFDDIWDFILLYSYYFSLGIIILIILILALRFYKPLAKFLKE